MIVNAYLERRPESLCTNQCQVEKVVELPAHQFDAFVYNPQAGIQEFIAENKKLMRSVGVDNHCLLVLGEDRIDGVLVNSEGTDQVRYAAHLPCARTILAAALEQAAELIAQECVEAAADGGWSIPFKELCKRTGLVANEDNGIGAMLLEALRRRPELSEVEMTGKGIGAVCRPACRKTHTGPEERPARSPEQLTGKILDYLAEHESGEELYQMLHVELGMTSEEIGSLGFDLSQHSEEAPGMTQPQL